MPTIRIELDRKSFRRLAEMAVEERRPIPWQAEKILLCALAVPVEGGTPGADICTKPEAPCATE